MNDYTQMVGEEEEEEYTLVQGPLTCDIDDTLSEPVHAYPLRMYQYLKAMQLYRPGFSISRDELRKLEPGHTYQEFRDMTEELEHCLEIRSWWSGEDRTVYFGFGQLTKEFKKSLMDELHWFNHLEYVRPSPPPIPLRLLKLKREKEKKELLGRLKGIRNSKGKELDYLVDKYLP